jgi:dolichyl-phosphate beta-glucosyltransferase
MNISIVIPAYNEEERIVLTLNKISNYLKDKNFNYEIIVVNDGSKDKTNEIVLDFVKKHSKIRLINNPKNMGKGYSVRNGLLNANKEWILFSDADLSTPIEELDKFIRYTSRFDIIIGSRAMRKSKIVVKQPWFRAIPGKVFPLLVRMIAVRGIKDTQCGFKMFKKDCVKKILKKQTIYGWAFDAELLFIAKKLKLKIKEVPIVWKNDANSKLDPIKNSISMFLEVVKIRWNAILGKYR